MITLPLHFNIGGILQAYALQHFLLMKGHDVILFDRTHDAKVLKKRYYWKIFKYWLKYLSKKIKGKKVIPLSGIQREYHNHKIITQETEHFINAHIRWMEVKNYKKLKANEWDVLLVGSDQIWRRLFTSRIEDVYLDFATSWRVKRIAYAPSFGVDEWDYSPVETKRCAALLQKFDWVSVREESAVKMCKEHFNVEAEWVLDPTLLLSTSDYEALVKQANVSVSDGNMLVYLMDYSSENHLFVSSVARKIGLKPFHVYAEVENEEIAAEKRVQVPVEKWLRGFMDAELVVTDSFHACVFSILFNVPFVVLAHKDGGMPRIWSLLNLFGLQERLVSTLSEMENLPPIDWNRINQIREERKARISEQFDKVLQ